MTWLAAFSDPEKNIPVWQTGTSVAHHRTPRMQEERARNSANARTCHWHALGDGSDYASFLDHAGISALKSGYRRRKRWRAVSLHLRRFLLVHAFLDTDFSYGRALAQTGGTTMMRLADADVIPFEFTRTWLKRSGST